MVSVKRHNVAKEPPQNIRPAIQLDHVSKRFMLRTDGPRSFQDAFIGLVRSQRSRKQEFWALRDVSFEVQPGETLGLIGPNGSGKSTILKLISRILTPTEGHITVNGRVSSLLELGAGFHPDLTGRENIYLNGSVLGLSRREINERLDDIIAFAELERFIDMPVKHYSSGMYMRLGFAVAAHVEPDILLVDEVLAVGDQSFQLKCYDRIADLRSRGVTIIFVSHSLDDVRRLCTRAIWLEDGEIRSKGHVDQVIEQYLSRVMAREESQLTAQGMAKGQRERWGSGEVRIVDVEFYDQTGQRRHIFTTGERMRVRIRYVTTARIERPVFGVAIYRADGLHINGPNTRFSGYEIPMVEGKGELWCTFEMLPLLEGRYWFSASVYDETCTHPYDHLDRVFPFRVQAGAQVQERYGTVYIPCHWQHIPAA